MTGNEMNFIQQAVQLGKISGNGLFTKKCHNYFEQKYGFKKVLLTTSCTDALEMCAILANIEPGDEIIVPSYTFVSSALAFVRQGAKIVFVDSHKNHPGVDEDKIESLINSKTKAIVPVHYAGVACDMDKILALAGKYNLLVIEDAAQAIGSFYKGKPLGSFGHLAAFSFHETKNINSGEGGLLIINDERFIKRSEIIWEKGTNRCEFFRGDIDKYGWVDIGSSFLPSEIIAAYLLAQLEKMDDIQNRRIHIWNQYYIKLEGWAKEKGIQIPHIPSYSTNNGHMFYLVLQNLEKRTALIKILRENNIHAVFHYTSLHSCAFYLNQHDGRNLPEADRYSDCLLRLPFYYELEDEDISKIVSIIITFNGI